MRRILAGCGRITLSLATLVLIALAGVVAHAQEKPFSQKSLVDTLRTNAFSTRDLVRQVKARGVDFQLTPEIEQGILKAGAYPDVVDAVRANYRASAAAGSTGASAPSNAPLSQSDVISMLRGGQSAEAIEKTVEARGVDFTVTPEIGNDIVSAGGTRSLVGTISTSVKHIGPTYSDYLDLTGSALTEKQYAKAAELLELAIKLDPARPAAYQYLGFIQFYIFKDVKGRNRDADRAAGEQNMRAAIERGGEAGFVVLHLHTTVFTACGGIFYVRKGSVAYEPVMVFVKSKDDSFDVPGYEVRDYGAGKLFAAGTFHLTVPRNGGELKVYSFKMNEGYSGKDTKLVVRFVEDYR